MRRGEATESVTTQFGYAGAEVFYLQVNPTTYTIAWDAALPFTSIDEIALRTIPALLEMPQPSRSKTTVLLTAMNGEAHNEEYALHRFFGALRYHMAIRNRRR